ncbi:MAG: hypothetical protein J0I75_10170 [Hyphomicrobium sp.]|nr:hypothetical protein [Hyphomicrobium sp.]
MTGVASSMQDLEQDQTAVLMDTLDDRHKRPCTIGSLEDWRAILKPAFLVRRVAAGHNKGDPITRARGIKGNLAGEAVRQAFQPGVHRPHDHPVFQHPGPDRKRREKAAHVTSF